MIRIFFDYNYKNEKKYTRLNQIVKIFFIVMCFFVALDVNSFIECVCHISWSLSATVI